MATKHIILSASDTHLTDEYDDLIDAKSDDDNDDDDDDGNANAGKKKQALSSKALPVFNANKCRDSIAEEISNRLSGDEKGRRYCDSGQLSFFTIRPWGIFASRTGPNEKTI